MREELSLYNFLNFKRERERDREGMWLTFTLICCEDSLLEREKRSSRGEKIKHDYFKREKQR